MVPFRLSLTFHETVQCAEPGSGIDHRHHHVHLVAVIDIGVGHNVVITLGVDVDLIVVVIIVVEVIVDVGTMLRMFMAVARKVIWAILTAAASAAVGHLTFPPPPMGRYMIAPGSAD